jgi:hypothetical protein
MMRRSERSARSFTHSLSWNYQSAWVAHALQLEDDLSDVVIGPYDFATLCNVSREAVKRTKKELDPDYVTKLFNRCLALNQQARVIIAHATWFSEGGGASHFSRNTFTKTSHFQDVKDINEKVAEAKHLMLHVIGATGWKGVDLKIEIPPL